MSRRRRILKWTLITFAGLLSVILLFAAGALIFIHTDRGRSFLRAQVEARLDDMIVGGASIGKLEGSPFGTLIARDVVLNGPDGKPAITVEKLQLRLAILPLISDRATISGLVAEGVDVDLRRDPDGTLQITRLMKPGPESKWSVHIPDVTVRDARVAFDSGDEVMHFDDLGLTGGVKMPHGGPLFASLHVRGTWRERDRAPLELDVAVEKDAERLYVPTVVARAGDVHLLGLQVRVFEGPAIGGAIAIQAPRAAVTRLVPEVDLPADANLELTAVPDLTRRTSRVELEAEMGEDLVRGSLEADLAKMRANGVVSASELDLATWTRGKVAAKAGGFVLFDLARGEPGKLPTGSALVNATAAYEDIPRTRLVVALDASGDRVTTRAGASNRALTATIDAALRRQGDAIVLDTGHVVASTRDPVSASGGKAPVHGVFHADLTASGELSPRPRLAVAGRVDGKRLRARDLTVDSFALKVAARELPERPLGRAELTARGLVRGDLVLRELDVTAANRDSRTIAVTLRSRPKQDPWLVEADAIVRTGEVVTIDLQRHFVRAGNQSEWSGNTGHVAISPQRIELRDFKSESTAGVLAAAATYGRQTGDVRATVDAHGFSLAALTESYAGTVDAHVDMSRRAGKIAGTATLAGKAVTMKPGAAPIDAEATITADPAAVVVEGNVGSPQLGTASLSVDLQPPANTSDPAAWKRLGRSAIREGRLVLSNLRVANLAKLAGVEGEYQGRIDGDVRISSLTTGGVVHLRGMMAPALSGVGAVSAELAVAQSAPNELTPSLTARVGDLGSVDAQARFAIPDHLFDPAAWRALGRGAIRHVSVRSENIEIDPAQLDRFGITTYARGRASIIGEISEGLADARLSVTVRTLRGSPISQPVDVDMLTVVGADETKTTMTVVTSEHRRVGKDDIAIGPRVPLLEITGTIPLTFDELRVNPRGALAEPLKLVARMPNAPARHLLAVFGRTEITAGTLDGTIDVAGTIGAPTVTAKLLGKGLQVPPGRGGKPVKIVERLALDASWDGKSGKLVVDGTEANGTLHVEAAGSPDALDDVTVAIKAKAFDMLPLLVFAPGPAGASAGRLDADLKLRGLDPVKAKLAGELHVQDGRFPIAPAVGTLRRAKIDVVIGERTMTLAVDGRVGGGSVKAKGSLGLSGAQPTDGTATLTLRKVSPIGVVEPDIDTDATIKLRREPDKWVADVVLRRNKVVVPKERNDELFSPGAPSDMVFITGERITSRPMKKAPPTRPLIVANVTILPTYIESEELRGMVRGKLQITADADDIGLVGTIEADRGDLDLFGHRYQVERAAVRFDGGIDPLLDIRITRDFPSVTTITQVRGRLSKPELTMSSNPGTYSQGQLLGFLLGGEPGGEPGDARDRATSAGASFVANQIGGYFKKALPVDLDVLRYEHATATSSAAITVGTWLTRGLFLAYRQRLAARPDENSGEAEIEYWISRRVVVEGVVGDRNYNGVDLIWRKRY